MGRIHGSPPSRAAVVRDNRSRKNVRVVAHPTRHAPVHRGLKLDQHQQLRPRAVPPPAALEGHPPEGIAKALFEAVAGRLHISRGNLLGVVEIQFVHPRHHQPQQVAQHFHQVKGELVGTVVVHGDTP